MIRIIKHISLQVGIIFIVILFILIPMSSAFGKAQNPSIKFSNILFQSPSPSNKNLSADIIFIIDLSDESSQASLDIALVENLHFSIEYFSQVSTFSTVNGIQTRKLRLGVIGRGEDAQIILPMTEIHNQNVTEIWQQIETQISSLPKGVGDYSFTNSLNYAEQMFSDSSAENKYLVFLTNGYITTSNENYSSIISELIQKIKSGFEPSGIEIQAIVVNSQYSSINSFQYQPIWRELTSGNSFFLQDPALVGTTLARILYNEIPPLYSYVSWIQKEFEIYIYPNVQSNSFSILTPVANLNTELVSPSGLVYRTNHGSTRSQLAQFAFSVPMESGSWTLNVESSPAIVLMSPPDVLVELNFLGPINQVRQYEEIPLTFNLRYIEDKLLVGESSVNSFSLQVKVVDPEGNSINLVAQYMKSGVYIAKFIADKKGKYFWTAKGKALDNQSFSPIKEINGSLEVFPAIPVHYSLIEPLNGSSIPIYTDTLPPRAKPLHIVFEVDDPNGLPIDLSEIWQDDPISLIQVEIRDFNDKKVPIHDIEYKNKQFIIENDFIIGPGLYKLKIQMPEIRYFNPGYAPAPSSRVVNYTFYRIESNLYKYWSKVTSIPALIFYSLAFLIIIVIVVIPGRLGPYYIVVNKYIHPALNYFLNLIIKLIYTRVPEGRKLIWEHEIEGVILNGKVASRNTLRITPNLFLPIALSKYHEKYLKKWDLIYKKDEEVLFIRNSTQLLKFLKMWSALCINFEQSEE